jgi:heme-degrading monooxygenase HmoA
MILEVAILNVRGGLERDFEAAFAQASPIIASMPGYISHQLQRCIETSNRYALLVHWTSLEAHTVGFRGSPEYQLWRQLLHHFYDPFPSVEHYELVAQDAEGRQAGRPARGGADEVRADDQSENREGAGTHDPAAGAGARG